MAGQKNEQGTRERKRERKKIERGGRGSKQSKYESLNTL